MSKKIILLSLALYVFASSFEIIPYNLKSYLFYTVDSTGAWSAQDTATIMNEDSLTNKFFISGWSVPYYSRSNRSMYNSSGKLLMHIYARSGKFSNSNITTYYNEFGEEYESEHYERSGTGIGTSRTTTNSTVVFNEQNKPIEKISIANRSAYKSSSIDTSYTYYTYDPLNGKVILVEYLLNGIVTKKTIYDYQTGSMGEDITICKIQSFVDTIGDYAYDNTYTVVIKAERKLESLLKKTDGDTLINRTVALLDDLNRPITKTIYASLDDTSPLYKYDYTYLNSTTDNGKLIKNSLSKLNYNIKVKKGCIVANLGNNYNHENCKFEVLNLAGKVVTHGENNFSKHIVIDTKKLSKGYYVVRVKKNNDLNIFKVIIEK